MRGTRTEGLVEELLFAQPVVAEIIPVVRGEDDHCVARPAAFLQIRDEPADLVVDLRNQPHVGGDHPLAHLVAAEHLGEPVLAVRGEHRVRVLAFGLAPHRGQDVLPAVHAVVRGGDDVRPVRLDVAQMQAPRRVARLLDELDGAGRRVGGLAVRLLDAGRPFRMPHQPPGQDLAVFPLRGSWPTAPRGWARRSRAPGGAPGSGSAADPRSGGGRRAGPRRRTRTPRPWRPPRCPGRGRAVPSPRGRPACGSSRRARSASRGDAGGHRGSSRRPEGERRSRSSRGCGRSARCRSSSGSGHRSGTARRRDRSAPRARRARRGSGCGWWGGRSNRGSRSEAGPP